MLEAVELLLKLGADVNAVDDNGETAMHGAAYRNHPKVVQLLADKGAKIAVWNRENKTGYTPLVIAEGYRRGPQLPAVPGDRRRPPPRDDRGRRDAPDEAVPSRRPKNRCQ